MSQQDDEQRMREEVKELEEARLRISGHVMEGRAGALEEDERLRQRIVELTRGLMSGKEEQGGGGAVSDFIHPYKGDRGRPFCSDPMARGYRRRAGGWTSQERSVL